MNNFKTQLNQIELDLDKVNSNINALKGQVNLLNEQIDDNESKIEDFTNKTLIYRKSVELLTMVEKSTKGLIKSGFEKIVTHALIYILNNKDYGLEVDFGRRGNLQTVDFNLKTPKDSEPQDPNENAGGAVKDILSLALRVSLLELTAKRNKCFLTSDEPFSAFDGTNLLQGAKFLKVIADKMGRQIILVTHHSELQSIADKLIEIG